MTSSGGFELKRREAGGRISTSGSLSSLFDGWRGDEERWLFIAPHDDDVVMGAGLLLQCAVAQGVAISVLVTTDGSMGYCETEDRDRIQEIRREETRKSFSLIGVEDVSWLNFPDCCLTPFLGRRRAREGEPGI
ncbi:MAG TPA: PIG-L family deacetylase, partial [Spirochaetia bacterium]|nr:PIG-L family deacetylase [Spirochaetia bacterium]